LWTPAKKITLPNRPTSQLPLIRTRWQEFSVPLLRSRFVRSVTLRFDPRMLSSRVSPPSGGRKRDLLSVEMPVPPISGRLPFRDFVEICVRGGAFEWACPARPEPRREPRRAGHTNCKTAGAKPCRMNTCTKMVGGWGTCCDAVFQRSRAAGPNQSDLALCPLLVSPVDSYSCTKLRGNHHGMILLQKNIGGRGRLN